VEFLDNIARKSGDAALLKVEVAKTLAAAEIGRTSGLFRVPGILDFNEATGVLDCERIRGLKTFVEFVIEQKRGHAELAERIGRSLARIHAALRLEDALRAPLPRVWMGDEHENVFLHGDFTANNVCIDPADMSIVIVDWSAAPFVGRVATFGPASFDVAWFVRHMLMGATTARTLTWPGRKLCDRFIEGYVGESGSTLDPETWQRMNDALDPFARKVITSQGEGQTLFAKICRSISQRFQYRVWTRYAPPEEMLRPSDQHD